MIQEFSPIIIFVTKMLEESWSESEVLIKAMNYYIEEWNVDCLTKMNDCSFKPRSRNEPLYDVVVNNNLLDMRAKSDLLMYSR